jgi:CRP/FNR family transcriptional regulator, cyclic AMP receptor protein
MKNNKVIHSSFWSNIFRIPTDLNDLEQLIHSIPLFSHLNKKDLQMIVGLVHNRNYVSGEYVFYQGDPGIGLYMIREGEVKVERQVNGSLVTLATFSSGDFFGELALIDGEKRSASAIAKSDTRLSVLFKPDIDDFIEKFPKKGILILQGILQVIASRLRFLNEEYIHLQIKNNSDAESSYGT